MAKKKAATKKSSGNTKPAKKAASNNKRNEKVTSKTTTKASAKKGNVKVAAKTLAKSNGVQTNGDKKPTIVKKAEQEKKSTIKKIAASATGSQHTKQKQNGTEELRSLNPQTYQMLRQDIISTLWKYDEITFDELCAAMEKIHGKNFVNDSIKYVRQVMADLINIELIESIDRDANRSIYRIRQRLSE